MKPYICFQGLQGIHLDTQHPQGITGLEKVQKVEDNLASKYQRQASLPEATFPKPIFVVPLEAEFILAESKPLHLEAQVEPKNDPNLKIEWYFNGKVLDLGKLSCAYIFSLHYLYCNLLMFGFYVTYL